MRFGLENGMRGGFLGMMVIGWLIGLVVLALMILGIIALVRYLQRSGTRPNHPPIPVNNTMGIPNAMGVSNTMGMPNSVTSPAALQILDERYARGEIGDEEYAAKKAELRK